MVEIIELNVSFTAGTTRRQSIKSEIAESAKGVLSVYSHSENAIARRDRDHIPAI